MSSKASGLERLGKVCLLTLLAVGSLVVAELAARLVHQPSPVRRVFHPFAYRTPQPNLIEVFEGLEGGTVRIELNELGMRGPGLEELSGGDRKVVVFLGGSTTENYGFARDATFPELIGASLVGNSAKRPHILNAGASAATSAVSLGRLQHQILDLQPDLVVVLDGINDLLTGFHPAYQLDSSHLPRPALASDRPRSFIYHWLRSRRIFARPQSTSSNLGKRTVASYETFPALRAFRRNLRSIAAVAEAHAIPILFLTQPTMYAADPAQTGALQDFFSLAEGLARQGVEVPDVASLARGMEAFNRAVRDVVGIGSARVFDLADRIPREKAIMYDDCHFTSLGNRRVAEELAPVIQALLAKPTSASPKPMEQPGG